MKLYFDDSKYESEIDTWVKDKLQTPGYYQIFWKSRLMSNEKFRTLTDANLTCIGILEEIFSCDVKTASKIYSYFSERFILTIQ